MDPIIIGVIALLLIVLAIRMFFGVAKTVVKLAIFVAVAIVVWRVMQGQ